MSTAYYAELEPATAKPADDELLAGGPAARDPESNMEALGGTKLAEGVWEFDGHPLELVEQLAGAELSKFEEQHPRWPKGTPKAGQFMHVGDRFNFDGKDYEVAHILGGKVVAHLETSNPKDAKTVVLDPRSMGVKEGATPAAPTKVANPHESDVLAGVSPSAPKKFVGGKSGSNVLAVDPYVDQATHDPSVPIPANSPVSDAEWKRFGKVDQEKYAELQKRFGKYSPSATKKHLDAAYGKYESSVQQLVKSAFSHQYGSSSGWTLSLTSLFNKATGKDSLAKLVAQREKAKRLQREVADAVQWDLYNRTRSPDVVLFHKSSDSPSWWESKVFSGSQPAFSGLSQSFRFDANWGFGSTTVMTPTAIRHITMSSFSAQPIPGESHFASEYEVSVSDQQAMSEGKSLVITKSNILPNHFKWLAQSTHEPHGGAMFDQFKAALDGGEMLPMPPAAPSVQMEGEGAGKEHLFAALPEDFSERVNSVEQNAAGLDLPKAVKFSELGYAAVTPEGAGGAAANTLELKPGDFIRGQKGALYVIAHDPEDHTGWGFARIELDPATGAPNGKVYNFSNQGTSAFYKLDGHVDLPPPKKEGVPGFVPTAWSSSEEQKFLSKFEPGEKFKVHGNPYEVAEGAAPAGWVKIKSLDTGKLGQINGDFKTSVLLPNEEAQAGPKLTFAEPQTVEHSDALGPSLVHVKPAGGTTGAAYYKDAAGEMWVVKHYGHDENRLATEALANGLLAHLGMNAPETVLTKVGGEPVIATRVIEGDVKPGGKWTAQDKAAVSDQFVAHALIANWDVVGLVHDNVLHGPSGATPIDQGGSFEYRAQGGHKDFGGDSIPELATLRDPKLNPASADVFAGVTQPMIEAQAYSIVESLTPEAIDQLVESAGFQDKGMALDVADGLKGRLKVLQELAPGALPGAKLMQYELPGGAPDPKPGMVFAYGGKKATVSKVLKDGTVQANLAPGVVKFAPGADELKGLHDPAQWAAGDKAKLKALAPGQKFHGGTGAKVKPYEVVEQKGKTTLVRNIETGAIGEVSSAKSYRVLDSKVNDANAPPAPGTPTSTPAAPVVPTKGSQFGHEFAAGDKFLFHEEPFEVTKAMAEGKTFQATSLNTGMSENFDGNHVFVAMKDDAAAKAADSAPFDISHFDQGEQTTLDKLESGQHFLGGNGDPYVVVSKFEGVFNIKNLSNGWQGNIGEGANGTKAWPLTLKGQKPDGEVVPATPGFDPAAHVVGEPQPVAGMELGTLFQSPKGGYYSLDQKGEKWATATNLLTGKPYPIKLADGKSFAVLTPKNSTTQPTPYFQLKHGDDTPLWQLKPGDQFKISGLDAGGPTYVLKANGTGDNEPAMVAALGPNGEEFAAGPTGLGAEDPVVFIAHAGEGADTLPFSEAQAVNVEDLPSATNFALGPNGTPMSMLSGYAPATDELFQPYKSTHGPGGAYKHHRISEMGTGSIFQDKGGKVWMVKQNDGAFGAVITDGQHLFKVDEKLRGRVLGGKDAAGFTDASPALGNGTDWEQAAVEQNLVPAGGVQLADLAPGDHFQGEGGGIWKVYSSGPSVGAINIKTGVAESFDPGAQPLKVATQSGIPIDHGEGLGASAETPESQKPPLGSIASWTNTLGEDLSGVVHSYGEDGFYLQVPGAPTLHFMPYDYPHTLQSDPAAEKPFHETLDFSESGAPLGYLHGGDHFKVPFSPDVYQVISSTGDQYTTLNMASGEYHEFGGHVDVLPATNTVAGEPPATGSLGEVPVNSMFQFSPGGSAYMLHSVLGQNISYQDANGNLHSTNDMTQDIWHVPPSEGVAAGQVPEGKHFEAGGAIWKATGLNADGFPEGELVQHGGAFQVGTGWAQGGMKEFPPSELVKPTRGVKPTPQFYGSHEATAGQLSKGDSFWVSPSSAELKVDEVSDTHVAWTNASTSATGVSQAADAVFTHADVAKSEGAIPEGMKDNQAGLTVLDLNTFDHFQSPSGDIWQVDSPGNGGANAAYAHVVYSATGDNPVGTSSIFKSYTSFVPEKIAEAGAAPDAIEPAPIEQQAATFATGVPPIDLAKFSPSHLTLASTKKVSEMKAGEVWKSPKGDYFQKLGETTVTNKNGKEQKAWVIRDLQTGKRKKTVAFALAGKYFDTYSYDPPQEVAAPAPTPEPAAAAPPTPEPPPGVSSLEDIVKSGAETFTGKVTLFRVGPTGYAKRGVFFGDSPESISQYASLHEGHEGTQYVADIKNAKVYESAAAAFNDLFPETKTHYGETPFSTTFDKYAHQEGVYQAGAIRKIDERISARLRAQGYDALIYTKPALPAKHELGILTPATLKKLEKQEPPAPASPPIGSTPPGGVVGVNSFTVDVPYPNPGEVPEYSDYPPSLLEGEQEKVSIPTKVKQLAPSLEGITITGGDHQTQEESGYPWPSVTFHWKDGTATHDQYEQMHDLGAIFTDAVYQHRLRDAQAEASAASPGEAIVPKKPAPSPSEHYEAVGVKSSGDLKPGDIYAIGGNPKHLWQHVETDQAAKTHTAQHLWGPDGAVVPVGAFNTGSGAPGAGEGQDVTLYKALPSAPKYLPTVGEKVAFVVPELGEPGETEGAGTPTVGEVYSQGTLPSGAPHWAVNGGGKAYLLTHEDLLGPAPQEPTWVVVGTDPETGGLVHETHHDYGAAHEMAGWYGGTLHQLNPDGTSMSDYSQDDHLKPETPHDPSGIPTDDQFDYAGKPYETVQPGEFFKLTSDGIPFQKLASHKGWNTSTGDAIDVPDGMNVYRQKPGATNATGAQDDPFGPAASGDPTPATFTEIDRELAQDLINAPDEQQYFDVESAVLQHLGWHQEAGDPGEMVDQWLKEVGAHFGFPTEPGEVDPNPFGAGATGGVPTSDDAAKGGGSFLYSLKPGDKFTVAAPGSTSGELTQFTVSSVDYSKNEVHYATPTGGAATLDGNMTVWPVEKGTPAVADTAAVPDVLTPYASAWGSGGKYKHDPIGDLQPGSLFTDKSKKEFVVVGHDNGVTHYVESALANPSPDKPTYTTDSSNKVRSLGGAQPKATAPEAAQTGLEKALAIHGSVGQIPDSGLQAFASAYGSGGKYKHPKLSDLQAGQPFVDKSGKQHTMVGLAGKYAVVHTADGGYGLHPHEGRVKTHGVGGGITGELGVEPKPPEVPKKGTPKGKPVKGQPIEEVEANEAWNAWASKLNQGEKDTLDEYQGGAYGEVNEFLRSGKTYADNVGNYSAAGKAKAKAAVKAQIARIDSALKKAAFHKDSVVYRGVHDLKDVFGVSDPKKLVGGEFTEKGFASTSISAKLADSWVGSSDNGVVLRITVPKGTPGGYMPQNGVQNWNDSEHEVLLPRGTKFRVTAAHTEWGKAILDLEVIG